MVSMEDYEKYIKDVEEALEVEKDKNRQLIKGQTSMFESIDDENLIKWQLDLEGDKDKIYHLLKGDKIEEDGEGNTIYVTPENIREIPFCDYGVSMIMQIINYYLTKNIILSNYDLVTIDWKVLDFGEALNDYFCNHYEELLRIPTVEEAKKILAGQKKKITIERIRESQEDYRKEKLKILPLVHQAIVNTVHSAYLRAYRGGERESLRTARTVTQSEPLAHNLPYSPAVQPRKFSMWKPGTWKG